jgi:hypothetical protein
MYICPALKSNSQPTKLMKPTQGSLYHPSICTQTTAMWLTTLCQKRQDVPASQLITHWLRVISPISLHLQRASARPATLAFDGRDGIHQSKGLSNIVNIGTGKPDCQRDALSIGYDMVLAACLGPVSRVGACLVPPKTARTEALSSTARVQSIRSAACNLSRHVRWMRSHTPACCQSRRRLQQVIPLPQPISFGRSSQGMPVLSTNIMPARTCLSGILGLPPLGFGGAGGSNGSISSQSSSDTIGLATGLSSQEVSPILKLVTGFC